jgi:hypothetical protein
MAATHGSKEVVWMHQLCSRIRLEKIAMNINCNSQIAIFMAKNPTYDSRTKHIDVKYHFVRDVVERKKVLLEKVDTFENIVDSLTKSVSVMKFSWCREAMGIVSLGQ